MMCAGQVARKKKNNKCVKFCIGNPGVSTLLLRSSIQWEVSREERNKIINLYHTKIIRIYKTFKK
jgi:hypothetical protein